MAGGPTKGTDVSEQMGISRSSVMRISRAHKWHPYELQMLQHLTEDDPDSRIKFCEWTLNVHANVSGQNWVERLSTCGKYPATVASYDTICTNKINISHRFHHLYGDL
ncbi:hypothetical protein AVEN_248725-1 [Araneus ventricosus]|uniref:Uncharacterized protein n=1 Tax=Araneus ventricosus TaxID=182803 RepID=A0A4Y2SEU2_ARAVE|nr:hypothetical protein AVEN_248725-1 [Araneus ventricosus]